MTRRSLNPNTELNFSRGVTESNVFVETDKRPVFTTENFRHGLGEIGTSAKQELSNCCLRFSNLAVMLSR